MLSFAEKKIRIIIGTSHLESGTSAKSARITQLQEISTKMKSVSVSDEIQEERSFLLNNILDVGCFGRF